MNEQMRCWSEKQELHQAGGRKGIHGEAVSVLKLVVLGCPKASEVWEKERVVRGGEAGEAG